MGETSAGSEQVVGEENIESLSRSVTERFVTVQPLVSTFTGSTILVMLYLTQVT